MRFDHCIQSRFIPTHMGNGARIAINLLLQAVHPHAYGERVGSVRTTVGSGGSSPRIWGTGARCGLRFTPRRFIPTHMGNGYCRPSSRKPLAVHPHAYGERMLNVSVRYCERGSSPRIWGTVLLSLLPLFIKRFIPTHMGNGKDEEANATERPVHPHAYGERTIRTRFSHTIHGSSPRIWGTVAGR